MAEEQTLVKADFIYDNTLGMYDSSGNLQSGIVHNGYRIESYVTGQDEGVYFADMLHFNIDASGTDFEHRKTTTLFEYANGVKIVLKYYYSSEQNMVWFDTYHEDINGNEIEFLNSAQINTFGAWYPSEAYPVTNQSIYFNPFGCDYADYPTTDFPIADVVYTSNLFIQKPQSDFPHMTGFMEQSDVNRHFLWFHGGAHNDETLADYLEQLEAGGNDNPLLPIDPEDDISGPGGGGGEYNPYSDPIGHPQLPISGGDAISTGFVRVYNPSTGQLHALASKLWSDDFFETIKKINNDPMEAVISLHSIPFSISTVSSTCYVGNYNSQVAMPAVMTQFVSKNLGSIRIPEHWGSALDYSPYVVVDCFIPFVGVRALQVDDAIGKTLDINANVDILTGATIITVMCGNSVLYAWNTNVIVKHPITSSSMAPLYQSIMGMTGNVLNGAVSGGIGGAVGGALGSAINTAMSKHSQITRGGALAGNAGALGHFAPYLILHRPKQSLAGGFAHFKGYPSNITASIGSVTGYTEVESVHLTGIPGTDAELEEIRALLYNGVIL